MELTQSKSLLAKLMATENLHIEQRNVGTASFDVESRILTIPVLDKNISSDEYDLFLGHEVGHALYTPLDGMRRAINLKLPMSLMNVIEDSRIERKVKQKYPGIRQNFIRAYKELMRKDFFGTEGVDLNKLNFIDRVNLHCKAGVETNIVFDENEKLLLDEIENTQTYDDVIHVCKKVAVFMEEQEKIQQEEKLKQKPKQKPEKTDTPPNSETEKITEEDDSSEEEETDEQKKEEATGNAKESGEKAEKPSEKQNGPSAGTGREGNDSKKPVSDPVAHTDEAYRRNENRLFSQDSTTFYYGNVPEVDTEKAILDYKDLWLRYRADVKTWQIHHGITTKDGTDKTGFLKFREESKKVVSFLVKEFELRKNADQMKRASISKTGELNMNKIFSYKFSEDIFKRISVVPGGKSHGLVMFIDWSGSMHNHIGNTIKQLLNLVMFCKKVNIPYEVYAFSNGYDNEYYVERKANDMMLGSFRLLNLLSNRMNAVDFAYACAALLAFENRYMFKPQWFGLSGTPLNEAVVSAMSIVPKFQKDNKLQVVNTVFLTDGEGSKNTGFYDPTGRPAYQNGPRKIVIRDNVTKHEEIFDYSGAGSARNLTTTYIKLLKWRTKCHVVGFYIMAGRDFGHVAYDFFGKDLRFHELEKLKTEFRSDKYKIVTSSGYDEYYLLRAEGLDIDGDTEIEVKENSTTRGFVSAFSKFNNNRKTSRVVLNRFIGMIT